MLCNGCFVFITLSIIFYHIILFNFAKRTNNIRATGFIHIDDGDSKKLFLIDLDTKLNNIGTFESHAINRKQDVEHFDVLQSPCL